MPTLFVEEPEDDPDAGQLPAASQRQQLRCSAIAEEHSTDGSAQRLRSGSLTSLRGPRRSEATGEEESSESRLGQRAELRDSFRELGEKLRRDVREEIQKMMLSHQQATPGLVLSPPRPAATGPQAPVPVISLSYTGALERGNSMRSNQSAAMATRSSAMSGTRSSTNSRDFPTLQDKERAASQKRAAARQKARQSRRLSVRASGGEFEEEGADEPTELVRSNNSMRSLQSSNPQERRRVSVFAQEEDMTTFSAGIRFRGAAHRMAMESVGMAPVPSLLQNPPTYSQHKGPRKSESGKAFTRHRRGSGVIRTASSAEMDQVAGNPVRKSAESTFSAEPCNEKSAKLAWEEKPERTSLQDASTLEVPTDAMTTGSEIKSVPSQSSIVKVRSKVCFSEASSESEGDDDDWMDEDEASERRPTPVGQKCQQFCLKIASSAYFDNTTGLLVCLNAISIGVQTDYMARTDLEIPPMWLRWIETSFCIAFAFELIFRMVALRGDFFRKDMRWNVFDLVVVTLQVVEETVTMAAAAANKGRSVKENFSHMRVLRTLKLIRVVRVVRILRLIRELRTIVVCICSSLKALGWTVVLLVLIIYVNALYITQLVLNHRLVSNVDHVDESIKKNFGSLGSSIRSLYQSVSGGVDWGHLSQPLVDHISPWVGVQYCCYVGFIILAMLNVVTGVFVESVVKNAKEESDMYLMTLVRKLFTTTVQDNSGMVSWQEFEAHLDNKYMREFFQAIDVDVSDAEAVFKLLDVDGSGFLDFDEFLSGFLRLRGPARALEMSALMHDTCRNQKVQHVLSIQLQQNFQDVLDSNTRLASEVSALGQALSSNQTLSGMVPRKSSSLGKLPRLSAISTPG